MEPIITVNEYPIGWEWLDRVPLEDFTWLINRYNHNRYNITTMNIIYHIIRIILSVGTILTLIRNEKIYQAYKHHHPTNKLRYIISQILILILYTSSLILVSYTYRIILTHL